MVELGADNLLLEAHMGLVERLFQAGNDLVFLLYDALQPVHVDFEVLKRLKPHDRGVIEHLELTRPSGLILGQKLRLRSLRHRLDDQVGLPHR